MDLFFETCKHNETVNWVFFTDCETPINPPNNLTFIEYSFQTYKELVSSKLAINFDPDSPYKLCDIKPALGYIHADLIQGFDFFGYGDIDVVYGNIRKFYTDDVLKYHCISSHWDRLSGHLCLLKNTKLNQQAFYRIGKWRELFENPNHLGLDESKFSKIYLRHKKFPGWLRRIYSFHDRYQRSAYFKEQFSTVLFPQPWLDGSLEHPEIWYWKEGKLTNNKDKDKQFLYLHFMNWKSRRWLREQWGDEAAWESLASINHVPPGKISDGWSISQKGFYPL